jgi:hypothetical protein
MLRVRAVLLAVLSLATAIVVTDLRGNAASIAATESVSMHRCTDPNYTSSSHKAQKRYGSDYIVMNNVWDPIDISQTLYSCAHNSFYVRAHVADEGGAVQSYPSSQYTFASPPKISTIVTLTSEFGLENPPTGPGLDYEFAYDIWINGYSGNKHTELMIWEYNHGQRPAGSKVATALLGGATWNVWVSGEAGRGGGDLVTFVNTVRTTSGTAVLPPFFHYAVGKGWFSGGENADLWQIDWGAELCASPKGTVFDFTAFDVRR